MPIFSYQVTFSTIQIERFFQNIFPQLTNEIVLISPEKVPAKHQKTFSN